MNKRAALGIEAGGEVVEDHLKRVLLHHARVGVVGGQRVPVGDEEEAVVLVLQVDPVAQGADVVAEVQLAGGSHAAQHAAFVMSVGIGHQKPRNTARSA